MFWAPTKPCENTRRCWDHFSLPAFLSPCHPEQSHTSEQWEGFMSNHPFRPTQLPSNLKTQWLNSQDSKEPHTLAMRDSLRWQCICHLRNGQIILLWINMVTSLWEASPQEICPSKVFAKLLWLVLSLEVILPWTRDPTLPMICSVPVTSFPQQPSCDPNYQPWGPVI